MSFRNCENMMQEYAYTIDPDGGTYADVADEYYDSARHPTCANFREASSLFVQPRLLELLHPDAKICEVGTGKSLVEEICRHNNLDSEHLVLTDISPRMLKYSCRKLKENVSLCIADARKLPFRNSQFSILVASLGDPYNDQAFWFETARVLRPGGHCLFTTPAYDWAESFRHKIDAERSAVAEFQTRSGRSVAVPSLIPHPDQQNEMVQRGGLKIVERTSIPIEQLKSTVLSPKLCAATRGLSGSVVDGYHVMKI